MVMKVSEQQLDQYLRAALAVQQSPDLYAGRALDQAEAVIDVIGALRDAQRELNIWQHCANCHERMDAPGHCSRAESESEAGYRVMVDDALNQRDRYKAALEAIEALSPRKGWTITEAFTRAVHFARTALTPEGAQPTASCEWVQEADMGDTYDTSCGHVCQFMDGGPIENKQKFCGYCGRVLVEVPHQDSDAWLDARKDLL